MLFQHQTENVQEFSTRKDLLFAYVCLITACPHKLLEQIWEAGQEQIGNPNTEPVPMAIPITERSEKEPMALPSHPTDGETG